VKKRVVRKAETRAQFISMIADVRAKERRIDCRQYESVVIHRDLINYFGYFKSESSLSLLMFSIDCRIVYFLSYLDQNF